MAQNFTTIGYATDPAEYRDRALNALRSLVKELSYGTGSTAYTGGAGAFLSGGNAPSFSVANPSIFDTTEGTLIASLLKNLYGIDAASRGYRGPVLDQKGYDALLSALGADMTALKAAPSGDAARAIIARTIDPTRLEQTFNTWADANPDALAGLYQSAGQQAIQNRLDRSSQSFAGGLGPKLVAAAALAGAGGFLPSYGAPGSIGINFGGNIVGNTLGNALSATAATGATTAAQTAGNTSPGFTVPQVPASALPSPYSTEALLAGATAPTVGEIGGGGILSALRSAASGVSKALGGGSGSGSGTGGGGMSTLGDLLTTGAKYILGNALTTDPQDAIKGVYGANGSNTVLGISGGGLTGGRVGNTVTVLPDAGRIGLVSGLQQSYSQQGQDVRGLLSKVAPGYGDLTKSALANIENERQRTIGDLRDNLQRRRVLGSSFATDALARADAEFAQKKEAVRSEAFLKELDATSQLLQQAHAADQAAFNAGLTELNLEGNAALELARYGTAALSQNANVQAQLLANAAISNNSTIGTLLEDATPVIGKVVDWVLSAI